MLTIMMRLSRSFLRASGDIASTLGSISESSSSLTTLFFRPMRLWTIQDRGAFMMTEKNGLGYNTVSENILDVCLRSDLTKDVRPRV